MSVASGCERVAALVDRGWQEQRREAVVRPNDCARCDRGVCLVLAFALRLRSLISCMCTFALWVKFCVALTQAGRQAEVWPMEWLRVNAVPSSIDIVFVWSDTYMLQRCPRAPLHRQSAWMQAMPNAAASDAIVGCSFAPAMALAGQEALATSGRSVVAVLRPRNSKARQSRMARLASRNGLKCDVRPAPSGAPQPLRLVKRSSRCQLHSPHDAAAPRLAASAS